jgi:trimeric autotransporter adhesin
MKKTKITTKLLAILFAGTLSVFNAKGQNTVLDGTPGATCGASAGTGSNNTAVGCSAIAGSTGSYNTVVGNTSGSSAMTGTLNTCVGYSVGVNISSGSNNTFLGAGSGAKHTSGNDNIFVGAGAGLSNTAGNYSNFIGVQAGANSNVDNSVGVGYQALYKQTNPSALSNTSTYNVALGNAALYNTNPTTNSPLNGGYNTGVGHNSLYNNTTGNNNTASGYQAGYYTQTGSDNAIFGYQAGYGSSGNSYSQSCFFGSGAGYKNTTGTNCAFGYQALYSNSSGSGNNAFGYQALNANTTTSYNTAVGDYALTVATSSLNTAVGYKSLSSLNTGNRCTAMGYYALQSITTGTQSTAFGYESLQTATGGGNTGCGYAAGYNDATGDHNTYLGYLTTAGGSGYTNATAIGNSAVTNGSNTIMLGNAAANQVWVAAGGAYNVSDGRFKTNVTENVKGLAFINKLRPVTYNMNTQALDDFLIQNLPDSIKTLHKAGLNFASSMNIVHSGFIAQEVAQAIQTTGFTSSIVSVPTNSNVSNYGVNYAEIVVPLVKAVQELNHLDSLQTVAHKQDSTKISKQDSIIAAIQNQLNQLAGTGSGNRQMQNGSNNNGTNSGGATNSNSSTGTDATGIATVSNIELASNAAIIYQNAPNPFGDGTMVKYFIPENTINAQIVFYDEFGNQLNTFSISTTGAGQLNIASTNLAPGTYSYSLIINGKVVDTKKMIKTN